MSYLSTDEAYDYATLACWYQNSIDETVPPIWTDEHLEELLKDFYVIPKDTPTADVVPKSDVVAEIIDDLAREGLLNVVPWAITELKRKYREELTDEHTRNIYP